MILFDIVNLIFTMLSGWVRILGDPSAFAWLFDLFGLSV